MPRLAPRLLRQVGGVHPLLPDLLKATRDVRSARSELRWLREHAIEQQPAVAWRHRLKSYCARRARGVPLQYILGSEFFGDLEIKCRPGVLIPRQETASITSFLARLISESSVRAGQSQSHDRAPLRIVDLCTGSGCIPLLLQHNLQASGFTSHTPLHIVGVDVSAAALALSKENLNLNSAVLADSPGSSIDYIYGDVLSPNIGNQASPGRWDPSAQLWDIVVSNPPYISPRDLFKTTTRSVRLYEPHLALVPPADTMNSTSQAEHVPDGDAKQMADERRADTFYPAIFHAALRTNAEVVLVEVGDEAQARRVASIAERLLRPAWASEPGGMGLEIWRDEPTLRSDLGHQMAMDDNLPAVPVRGRGNVRAVFAWQRGGDILSDDLLL